MTASQDGYGPGILSSQRMAETDLSRVRAHADVFCAASTKFGVPAALLAAIASRESRASAALGADGWDASHNAFGVMQVDRRSHTVIGDDNPFSLAHIEQATSILASNILAIRSKHSDWQDIYILKGAVVAYNAGVSTVQTIENMDHGTTGNDYGSDVIARAQYYLGDARLVSLNA